MAGQAESEPVVARGEALCPGALVGARRDDIVYFIEKMRREIDE